MRTTIKTVFSALFAVNWLSSSWLGGGGASAAETAESPNDYLDNDSVVLITGAAGFLGSELAMALYRTYTPKKMILIDSMDSDFGGSSMTPSDERTEQELALLEFKRQRVFHVLQTLKTTAHFYRVDVRPNIPEFFQAGEVPILHHILNLHKDITHVVHLADHYHRGSLHEKSSSHLLTAVPRLQSQAKAGMMEALLEELRLVQRQGKAPHFVYASSHDVYNHRKHTSGSGADKDPNPPPFSEDLPLSTPSTLAGASKLMDEVLAQAYFETDELYTVGLRFFSVYGPWGLPGSAIFEMAEAAVLGKNPEAVPSDIMDDVRDYIYIDDAVDAIMSAMQFRRNVPVVFNVGTGTGTTLRSLATQMNSYFNATTTTKAEKLREPETTSFASTQRAEKLLGFKALVPVNKGIEQVLAWHYDRAFPYGGPTTTQQIDGGIASKGIVACARYDSECLKGAPVFPCASECSHPQQCTSSFYDDVNSFTRQITTECETVLYTVALDESLTALPTAQATASSKSYTQKCNVAFVADSSPLVRRLLTQQTPQKQLQHGPWTLVPVTISKHAAENAHVLSLLPKLSPGLFFGGGKTKIAVYTDPDVLFQSIAALVQEFEKAPQDGDASAAETAILVGQRRSAIANGMNDHLRSLKAIVQESAYRMIRIAAINEMKSSTSFTHHVDSSFVVHRLVNDARLFRCDVLQEVVQWETSSDKSALEFILGLHDMWSRVISKRTQSRAWYAADNINKKKASSKTQEEPKATEKVDANKETKTEPKPEVKEERRRLEEEEDDEEVDDETEEGPLISGWGKEHNGLGMPEAIQDAVRAVFGEAKSKETSDDDEEETDTSEQQQEQQSQQEEEQQPSSDGGGVWMGVLSSSSSNKQYFARIVPSSLVGAIHLEDERIFY